MKAIPLEYSQNSIIPNPDMLSEIYNILSKHDKLNKYGIAIINQPQTTLEQIKIETCNPQERTLTTELRNRKGLKKAMETFWVLNKQVNKSCEITCLQDSFGHPPMHSGQ